MKAAAWVAATTITLVNYCAFRGGRHKKPTQLWTTLEDWKPVGNIGIGRCEEKCGKGMKHDDGTFKHDHVIAGAAERALMGPRRKQQLWELPEGLTEELMDAVASKQPNKKYVIDMFSGGESWRKSAERRGDTYIPVDMRVGLSRTQKLLTEAAEAA